MGDKRALDILEVSEIKPVNLRNKINNILYGNNRGLVENLSLLKKLFSETIVFANAAYKPCYKLE